MANNLRYFVKLDSKNRPVAGSNIARPKKPKHDVWQELFPFNCCNITVSDDANTVSGGKVKLTLVCGSTTVLDATAVATVTTLAGVVNALNAAFPFIGTFSGSGSLTVTLAMDSDVTGLLCPSQSLVMTVTVSA